MHSNEENVEIIVCSVMICVFVCYVLIHWCTGKNSIHKNIGKFYVDGMVKIRQKKMITLNLMIYMVVLATLNKQHMFYKFDRLIV